MSKGPAGTASLARKIALLVLLILFCIANSGFFCPLEFTRKGGIECLVLRSYKSDEMQIDNIKIRFPEFTSIGGFRGRTPGSGNGALQSPRAPQGNDPVLVGYFAFDATGDNFPEDTQNILSPDLFEAFVDANNNGALDAESEIQMVFDGQDSSITITNPAGGTPLPMGYYSFTLFGPVLFLFGDIDFTVTASLDGTEMEVTRYAWANTSMLPHVPFGEVRAPAGGALLLSVLTEMVLTNAQDQPQDVSISFRNALTAEPQPVTIEGVTTSVHNIPVAANTSRLLRIEPTGVDLTVAWATVTGFGPLSVATNFVSLTPSPAGAPAGFTAAQIDAQAGIAAAELDIKHVVNVEKTVDGIGTALAIVNLTSTTATVKLSLFESAGDGPGPAGPAGEGNPFAAAELILEPKTQVARFFDELLQVGLNSFSGTLILESNAELAVTSLRTINGKQASSLPSGTP